jgi:leucyl aminopeptidase
MFIRIKNPGGTMNNLILKLSKHSEWNAGLVFTFAAAPEKATISSAAKEFGDIRYDLAANKALISLGKKGKINAETIRRTGGIVAKWLAKNAIEVAGIDTASLGAIGVPFNDAIAALVEGLTMGAFTFGRYKSGEQPNPSAVNLLVYDDQLKGEIESVFNRAVIVGDAVNLSREWAHEPPNVINPVSLAERVQQLAIETGLRCMVFDEKQLADMGAGAIVAVGKGSDTPSRLIVLEYAGKSKGNPVALVGKALTMDTGGYSVKTTDGMVGMKYDKCGGMTVIATMVAAARLGLKTPLVGVIAAAENMISGASYRPNDIIHTMSGKTVEIISTDAEGRMVLCDALTFTQKNFKPRAIVDLATLTGAVLVALGTVRAGLLSNNDSLAQALAASGERTFERLWRLPMDEEYFDLIKGDDSDMKNSSGTRAAGTIVGGIFLKQFVSDEVPWAHLDIAGMASPDKDGPYTPKGASGFGVRLLIDYLSGLE